MNGGVPLPDLVGERSGAQNGKRRGIWRGGSWHRRGRQVPGAAFSGRLRR
ncbi:hypothetical protein [Actinomadura spongiicola]|nr:hypothetical protein [Actinomadura spongiicola]